MILLFKEGALYRKGKHVDYGSNGDQVGSDTIQPIWSIFLVTYVYLIVWSILILTVFRRCDCNPFLFVVMRFSVTVAEIGGAQLPLGVIRSIHCTHQKQFHEFPRKEWMCWK